MILSGHIPSEQLEIIIDVIFDTRFLKYSETCVKRPLSKRPKLGFQDQLLLNTGQKYCIMLQVEHSAILSTFIKRPSLSYHLLLRSLFCLFLSGHFTQVLLYGINTFIYNGI